MTMNDEISNFKLQDLLTLRGEQTFCRSIKTTKLVPKIRRCCQSHDNSLSSAGGGGGRHRSSNRMRSS